MKDFLRLLFIAVLSFMIVGLAVAYTRDSDVLARLTSAVDTAALPQLELSVAEPESAEQESATEIWIPRPRADQWIGLAGFPDSTEIRFALPAGVNFTAGALRLAFDVQLGMQGDGRMTINVDGVRRGEVVLDPGQSRHEVEIALEQNDLLSDVVVVTFEGRGTTSTGQICPADAANSGAAVTLSDDSGLALLTDDPVDTRAVRIATMSDPAWLALGAETGTQALAIWARQDFARKGMEVRFAANDTVPDIVMAQGTQPALALDAEGHVAIAGEAGIEGVLAARMPAAIRPVPDAWPVTVDKLSTETLLKNFRGSRRWTIPYALADLPGGLMPRRFALELKTSTLAPGNDWVVRVSLNGNLLETGRFNGQGDTISLDVTLPSGIQTLSNTILVELIDTTPNDSICRVGPDAQAQLLPTSRLTPQGVQPTGGWPQMVRALAAEPAIGLGVTTPLTRGEARTAAAMLGRFLPAGSDAVFGTERDTATASIEITTADGLRSALRLAGEFGAGAHTIWLAVPDGDRDPILIAIADPRAAALIERLDDNAAVILIDL